MRQVTVLMGLMAAAVWLSGCGIGDVAPEPVVKTAVSVTRADAPTGAAVPAEAEVTTREPIVVSIETSMGTIEAELWEDKAPLTVANFLRYTDEKYYDDLIFHRVIKGFMIQGGGFKADLSKKATHPPIKNEARADVPNARGTLAMARTSDIDSASSQFFINLVDNGFLNHKSKTPQGFGYCAFGKVTKGMDVVDSIAGVKTGRSGPYSDVPTDPVVIKSVSRVGHGE